jgi:5-methylthioadenosine/S-adenosylhomocysteine deaminase
MGSDVRHVMVNGEIVVENGRSTRVDQDKVIADCVQASRALIKRAGIGELITDWIEP